MKAKIILNSYHISKNTILCAFFLKNWVSKIFSMIFDKKKNFLSANFSKKLYYNPQNFFVRVILNTKIGNYLKF